MPLWSVVVVSHPVAACSTGSDCPAPTLIGMPSSRRQSGRGRSRVGTTGSRKPSHSPQPQVPSPQPQVPGRSAAARKAIKSSLVASISLVIAAASALFTGLTYLDQHAADQASASDAVRHDAEQVSYWLQGVAHSTTPQLVIENRSGGPIRDLFLKFPQPMQGCSANCSWEAFDYISLADIPPCSIEATTVFNVFKSLSIESAALSGSLLDFTDSNGNAWTLYGGYGKLVELPGYKSPPGFTWNPSVTFTPAQGCS